MKKKKPQTLEEPAGVYHVEKPLAKSTASKAVQVNDGDDAAFKHAVDKVFNERKQLLRKLAQ